MPSSFAPSRSIARRLRWLKACVRNSTAMQARCSNAWASNRRLHALLRPVRWTARRYQVLPISTRRLPTSMFMYVVMPTALPLSGPGCLLITAKGFIKPCRCRVSRRSISVAMPSAFGMAVNHRVCKSPSRVASRRSSTSSIVNGRNSTWSFSR